MHVIVVGCGRVGSGLAAALESQGHSVAIVDRKPEAFRRLPEGFAGKRIQGVGFDRDLLIEAGVEKATALAAVTNGDNSNIVVARVAKEAFQVERVVARIYDQRRAAIYERVGIPTVATVSWAIERVLRHVQPDDAGVAWIDPSARLCLVERPVPSSWAGRPLGDLEIDGVARITGITRLGKGIAHSSSLFAQEGDVLWVAVAGDGIDTYDRHLVAGPSREKK